MLHHPNLTPLGVQDIDVYEHVDEDALPAAITKSAFARGNTKQVSATERSRQRGHLVSKAILLELFKGVELASNVTAVVVDYNPSDAEDWSGAALLLALDKISTSPEQPPLPFDLKTLAFVVDNDKAHRARVKSYGFVYQQWYDGTLAMSQCGVIP